MILPIWKDTYYTTSADTLTYEIQDASGTTLFTGKAYKAPEADELKVKLNDVCDNYIHFNFPLNEQIIVEHEGAGGTIKANKLGAIKDFYLIIGGESAETYTFFWDYSYDNAYSSSTTTLNRTTPFLISNHGCTGMYGLRSRTVYTNIFGTSAFTYSVDWEHIGAGLGNLGYVSGYCGDYALYYLNRYGGWTSYLIEGAVIEKDDFERSDYTTVVNNTKVLDRAKTRFNNQITHGYEIKTGWLSDAASKNLVAHLLSSNNVWLHNLKTDKVIPVIITDSSSEYKTFANERKMFGYTINVEESNKKAIK